MQDNLVVLGEAFEDLHVEVALVTDANGQEPDAIAFQAKDGMAVAMAEQGAAGDA